jgi:hypothetical protein
MQQNSQKTAAAGRLVGYARVSAEDQGTDPQLYEPRAAGRFTVLEEHASGADRSRPVLARLLSDIRRGETLVVVRLDRLARSVSHLLAVIEQLEATGAHFRSLRDPIGGDVVRVLNRGQAVQWTVERLRRTVRRLVTEGILEASLLDRAQPKPGDDRLIRLVAGIKAAAPDRTLQQIAAQLEAMHERTPRGGTRWHPSSVKHLLDQAERVGLTSV